MDNLKRHLSPRLLVLVGIALVLGLMRLGAYYSDFFLLKLTPLGAMALFGAAYFKRHWQAYGFPFIALFASDVLIMHWIYPHHAAGLLYQGWPWVYGAFLVMGWCARYMLRRVRLRSWLLSCLAIVGIHWLISNMGVWLGGGLNMATGLPYTRNISGLLACYIAALPYEAKFLLATTLNSAWCFGLFELLCLKYPILAQK